MERGLFSCGDRSHAGPHPADRDEREQPQIVDSRSANRIYRRTAEPFGHVPQSGKPLAGRIGNDPCLRNGAGRLQVCEDQREKILDDRPTSQLQLAANQAHGLHAVRTFVYLGNASTAIIFLYAPLADEIVRASWREGGCAYVLIWGCV